MLFTHRGLIANKSDPCLAVTPAGKLVKLHEAIITAEVIIKLKMLMNKKRIGDEIMLWKQMIRKRMERKSGQYKLIKKKKCWCFIPIRLWLHHFNSMFFPFVYCFGVWRCDSSNENENENQAIAHTHVKWTETKWMNKARGACLFFIKKWVGVVVQIEEDR